LLLTIPKLGLCSVAYVVWYKLSLKTGIRKTRFPGKTIRVIGPLYYPTSKKENIPEDWGRAILKSAQKILDGEIRCFTFHWKKVGAPPDWFLNPFNKRRYPNTYYHWTQLPDFHPEVGDIKNVWEASRFEWVVTLARAYAISMDEAYLDVLNGRLKDWADKNPYNTGPNWKCGQEASIRVFNLLNAARILEGWADPTKALSDFIYLHLKRIEGNIRYAIAQNNNHGTSEAAALFIGGAWLAKVADGRFPGAAVYAKKGRKWLENRIDKLVAEDGSFSQHSVNYHRVLLDTISFAEYWRRILEVPAFSDNFYRKARAATRWLWQLTDETSYDSPNLGANDGALLLNLHNCAYRDFRPSLQFANVMFFSRLLYPFGPWNEPLLWFEAGPKIAEPEESSKKSVLLDNAYLVMKGQDSWALLRLPRYKFRPSHNDVFHFDLWFKGVNVLCDSGSYSYNPDKGEVFDFKTVQAHNTAFFDDHEQMPRLGRFLLGDWIKPESIGELVSFDNKGSWEGSYKDFKGNRHRRKVEWDADTWVIMDWFSGPFQNARVGFNLCVGEYEVDSGLLKGGWGQITIEGAEDVSVQKTYFSKHYMEKEEGQRLVAVADESNFIRTTITLKG